MIIQEIASYGTLYAVAGAFAGLLAGVLGIGGGLVVVPMLAFIFQHNAEIPAEAVMHFAAGTSLAVMIFTAQASVRARIKKEPMEWPVFRAMIPGIIMGTTAGVVLAHFLSTRMLSILFGLFLLAVALKMLLDVHRPLVRRHPGSLLNAVVSFLIGLKSGLLGVGGGMLIIPYLSYCGVALNKVATVSALCTMTVALVGCLGFMLTGLHTPDAPAYAIGYVYWPAVLWLAIPSMVFAPIGAHLAYQLPLHQIRYAFVIILTITAVDLLV
ncbi:MAG: sulfite exporter TauE/SafE family protein [Legionellaceae bacterium]|nr:sulfite exporter TauE/SafE family protein [Legionellaceae bacterium]